MFSLVGENRRIPSQIITEFQHVEGRELIIKVPEREREKRSHQQMFGSQNDFETSQQQQNLENSVFKVLEQKCPYPNGGPKAAEFPVLRGKLYNRHIRSNS